MTQVQTTPNILTSAPCHTTLSCTDIDRTRQFYVDTLGLKVLEESDEGGLMLGAGDNTRLYIYPREDAPKAENTVAAFHVSDVPATVEALQGNGVTFEEYDLPGLKTEGGIAKIGEKKGAWFKDPDGNIIAVSEM